ncbi:DUF4417 domain-containing protein [Sphingobium lactosutens]|uniref:DUF4417 domain-containing protein n=1 Tax=Sphingobium lactosutens DS20 TaxID=1331060 RepID=T0J4Q0_9SPHN|nr:DUF4417 domain-containing protein [Sphingobium lactosutens]EQB16934.1 hypothetical protein RLDS_05730 [Sphingobium lactosutens DS20]
MKETQPPDPQLRRVPNSQSLWDDAARAPASLGCWTCVDKEICGGVHSGASFFDCNDYCRCPDKNACDLVCRGNPATYVARYREVGTFDLMKAPRAPEVGVASLPSMVPLIEHNSARHARLNFPMVALPLHKLVDLDKGVLRFRDREALATQFGIDPHARLVVSGVARDRRIERYWALPNRPALLKQLAALNIALLTPPNFSVLTGVPRSDNLHAMKRIMLVWVEMAQTGIPTALHINARTERDYERWAELIETRPEISCLAVEFATGAGRGSRIDWHVARLTELAAHVSRPLRLVLRGGGRVLEPLRQSFATVTMIDTDAFTKSRCRKQAYFTEAGKLMWRSHPTAEGEPIDDLLQHNVATLHSHHTYLERLHADRRFVQSMRLGAIENRDRKAI